MTVMLERLGKDEAQDTFLHPQEPLQIGIEEFSKGV